ncbi:hypothetical protein PQJ75_09355 [Rhodoplanes sp. TEM]|uniref:CTP synthetase n=1 Tax=Rhodoplanes tepidamans TaxID=200616 RepID=A0ABT5JDX7_RHOTP|nr:MULTISPECIES: hypothetical protein [Rhodoplanes]MDC7787474.1 hypothetical protein [Rhodoplanes tepidamans]MDC7983935.1 hypothetical protein [Rhodoplanes sp. TEM]MDQ0354374.1 hypothetical protein [Rhodoplanes tepidamans]
MLKLAVLVWMMLGTTLAGALVVVIVSVPSLYNQGMSLIPIAAAAGFVLAVPAAFLIARKIDQATARHA